MVAITWVYIHAMHFDFATSSIEVLVFQLTNSTTVHRISEVATELRHIEVISTLTNLLIRSETYTDLTVLDLRVLN